MAQVDDERVVTRERSNRGEYAKWYAQRATHATVRNGVRLVHPKTLGRSSIAAGRGMRVASVAVWDTVTAKRLADLRLRDPKRHHEIRRFRTIVTLIVIALGALGVRWLTDNLGGVLAWCLLGATALVTLILLGRKGPVLAPPPDLPGMVPADLVVRQAFVDAKLAKDLDAVKVTQPISHDRGAWTTVMELPPGIPARKAVASRAALASALGVGVIQLDLSPIRGNEQRVRVWCADRDPYDRKPVVSPLARNPRQMNIWEPALVGLDARLHEILIPLVFSGVLIGGLPRFGKTVTANNLLAHVLLDPHVRLVMADGKGMDSEPYRHLAHRTTETRAADELVDVLDWLEGDMDQRIRILTSMGLDKLNEEAAARDPRLAVTILWIDELRHYTDAPDKPTARAIRNKLVELASVGPSTGIVPILATQRPSAEVVPTDLRDLIPVRLALACSTSTMSDMILGGGAASAGVDASELDRDRKGVSLLVGTGARPTTLRSNLIEIDGMRRVAEVATDLRRQAGTLPASQGGRQLPPLILAIWSAMQAGEGVDRMRTAVLLDVLHRANPEWFGWDGAELGRQLAPYGLKPVQLGGDGNPRGYKRADVAAAIERVTGRRPL